LKDRNENRPGYKKTKVGWIPNTWQSPLLKDISLRITDGEHQTPNRSTSGHYLLSARNVQNGFIDLKEVDFVDKKEFKRLSKRIRPVSGDLLLSCSGTIGRCTVVPEGLQFAMVRSVALIRPKADNLNSLFLQFMLTSQTLKKQIQRSVNQLAQGNLFQGHIERLRIPLPQTNEQKKIAEILSTWDEAIEQTRKLINAKKHRKKALIQQLFMGKKRLTGFVASKGRKSYRFFDLPKDWECPQIRTIAQERSERNAGRDDLTVLSCSKHLGFVESSEYFGKQVFSADTSNYKIIHRNYFGYPSNHIEEGSIGLLLSHDIGIVSPIYTVFQCNENVIPEYLYALFKTDTFRHIFATSTNASVDRRGSLRWKEFSLIRVPLPSIKEQLGMVNILRVAENEIVQIERKLKALEKQKRGLMQKLLTGEIRVKL